MIRSCPATPDDYREMARRCLPRFLFDYVDGGAGCEQTLKANQCAWSNVLLRQRVLVDVSAIDTAVSLAGENWAMPLALAPIGLGGMTARRGEVQALRAAQAESLPFTLSTVGVCGLDELAATGASFWFQLYMIRDRSIVEALLARAWEAGCRTLVFTVDLPMPGSRHRDIRNGIGVPGLRPKLLKIGQMANRPGWFWDVALRGGPLSLGSMTEHVTAAGDPDAFRRWVDEQFDPGVTWTDIAWLRERWQGRLLLKGILDEEDARQAVDAGADGLVVSNHGGRQLDGVSATASVLPAIAEAVGERIEVLVDGGIRSGIDLFRALALGADGALIGRPWVWALAAGGQAALARMLASFRDELRIAMALTGVTQVADIGQHCLQNRPSSSDTRRN
ncbi:MAG: L-lactate dehydrogenase [Wenzhouxiangellaceae bacterium]|nr:MAG: L-lactate dehydrogenase [Wenzhouxiangellaceae bacterium]